MTRPRLIGLTGYAQSGKDSVAGFLKDYGYQRVAFADGVREALLALDPFLVPFPPIIPSAIPPRLSALVAGVGWDEAKKHPEVRRLLQRLGTEVVRDMVDPDAWVSLGMRKVSEILRT